MPSNKDPGMISFKPQQGDYFGKTKSSELEYRKYNDITKLNDPFPNLIEQQKYLKWKKEIIESLKKRGISLDRQNLINANTKTIKQFAKNEIDRRELIEKKIKDFYRTSDNQNIEKLIKEIERI
jgi:hypothetical protein